MSRPIFSRPLVALVLLSILLSAAALAGEKQIWVASGEPGGTYRDVYSRNMEPLMRSYNFNYRKTSGSGQNLELLADGRADIGFAQADVFAHKLEQNPARYGDLTVIGKLADECAYIAYRSAGPVTSFGQLSGQVEGRAPKLVVGGAADTGMSGTWSHFVGLKPELAATEVHLVPSTLGLNQLVLGAFDAVGWVTDPRNHDHKLLRAVIANRSLNLMDIQDPAFSKTLPDGTRIYTPMTVELEKGWRARKLKTVCTSALVFASASAHPKLVLQVSDLISLKRNRIVPKRPSPW